MHDLAYFFRRAEQELAMAAASDVPEAVRAHYLLAGYYLDRCYGGADVKNNVSDRRNVALCNHAAATAAR